MILIFESFNDDPDIAIQNLTKSYPEFKFDMKDVGVLHVGNKVTITISGYINKKNKNNMIELIHHAEGIYENTKFECVHVEVFIDGVWYGI